MAGLLGYIVAQPLTLVIFASEVRAELVEYHQQQVQHEDQVIALNPVYGDKPIQAAEAAVSTLTVQSVRTGANASAVSANVNVARLQNQYHELQAEVMAQQKAVEAEADGTGGSHTVGEGPIYHLKVGVLDQLEAQGAHVATQLAQARAAAAASSAAADNATANLARSDLATAKTDLVTIQHDRAGAQSQASRYIDGQDGLGAQMDALGRLRAQSGSISREFILLSLLLVTLDTSAVLLKLMERRTTLDEVQEVWRKARIERAKTAASHRLELDDMRYAHELAMQAALADVETHHQQETAEYVIDLNRRMIDLGDAPGPRLLSDNLNNSLQARMAERWGWTERRTA
jgi:hypothetical protein